MIKTTLVPTPNENLQVLTFETNGSTDDLDELYEAFMSSKVLGAAWRDSTKFEVILGKIQPPPIDA